MRKLIIFLSSALVFAEPAFAHAPARPYEHGSIWAVVAILLATMIYIQGLRRLAARGARGRIAGPWRSAAFAGGVVVAGATIASPVSAISEALFSAHMAAHLALMLICAPLFVAARADVVMTFAVSPVTRRLPFRLGPLRALWRILSAPLAIWLWFVGLFCLWHLPGFYIWALRSDAAHALEHACFLLSAYAFWSIAFSPARAGALGYGGRVLFVASAALLSGLPGALISISPRPLYTPHAAAAIRYGLTPLEDQQLAGLVMWIPGGLAYIVAVLALFALWLREAERKALRKSGAASTLVVCLATPLVLTGCDDAAPWRGRQAAAVHVVDGDPRKGAEYIAAIGCGACHSIPGVSGASGLVGPPLDNIGRRVYIAGVLRNTPPNLEAWLQDPQKIVPGNVMPKMGVSQEQSRDIAAYLYTLQ